MIKKTLFSGKDVIVHYAGTGTNYNVIVFRCAGNLPLFLKNGKRIETDWPHFLNLEGTFASEEVNEIYVEALHQHLYQTPEMEQAIKAIKDVLNKNSINVTFGLSMGATAAVDLAPEFNATFIALSPAGTLSGTLPLSPRVKILQEEYHYGPSNIERGLCKKSKGYIFFDYFYKLDRLHAYFIRSRTKAQILNEPYWGHSNAHKLNEVIKLNELVYSVLKGKFNLRDLKHKMYKAYYNNAHPNYILFLLKEYFKKKREEDLQTYLEKHIDMNRIAHMHTVIEKLRDMQQLTLFEQFTKQAYEKNPKNSKTQIFMNELIAYEKFAINFEQDSLSFLEKIYTDNKCSPSIYLLFATALEFFGQPDKAIEVIQTGIKRYPVDSQLLFRKTCLTNRSLDMHLVANTNLVKGKYTVINKNIYKIVNPNMEKIPCGISLKNIVTGEYLRHQDGKIMDSSYTDSNLFLFDSTYIAYINNSYDISFKCTNISLPNHFITRIKDFCGINAFFNKEKEDLILFSLFKRI